MRPGHEVEVQSLAATRHITRSTTPPTPGSPDEVHLSPGGGPRCHRGTPPATVQPGTAAPGSPWDCAASGGSSTGLGLSRREGIARRHPASAISWPMVTRPSPPAASGAAAARSAAGLIPDPPIRRPPPVERPDQDRALPHRGGPYVPLPEGHQVEPATEPPRPSLRTSPPPGHPAPSRPRSRKTLTRRPPPRPATESCQSERPCGHASVRSSAAYLGRASGAMVVSRSR